MERDFREPYVTVFCGVPGLRGAPLGRGAPRLAPTNRLSYESVRACPGRGDAAPGAEATGRSPTRRSARLIAGDERPGAIFQWRRRRRPSENARQRHRHDSDRRRQMLRGDTEAVRCPVIRQPPGNSASGGWCYRFLPELTRRVSSVAGRGAEQLRQTPPDRVNRLECALPQHLLREL